MTLAPLRLAGLRFIRAGVCLLAVLLCVPPAAGRQASHLSAEASLFDRVFAGDRKRHKIPYPFEALIARIRAHLAAGEGNDTGIQQVLIPLGRSLQRFAADPDFFKCPRVVVAVDGVPAVSPATGGLHLKDRLFLGYQEKAGVIEVISYNPARGRFEFQVVENYGPGRVPRVSAAERAVCTECHQNEGPIWSDPPWDETNDNAEVARLLKRVAAQFHGIPAERKLPSPVRSRSISDSVDRANRLSGLQRLWRQGCGSSPDCRGDLLAAVLRDGMRVKAASGNIALTVEARIKKLGTRLGNALPRGIEVPDPRIPNRNPIQNRAVSRAMNPLTPRAPLKTLHPAKSPDLKELVSGLVGLLAERELAALDAAMVKGRKCTQPTATTYSAHCAFSSTTLGEWRRRLRFSCGEWNSGRPHMEGRFYLAEGMRVSGKIDRLQFASGELLYDLELKAGPMRGDIGSAGVVLDVRNGSGERRARRSDGHAVEKVVLSWRSLAEVAAGPDQELVRGSNNGIATFEVVDDVRPLLRALTRLKNKTKSGAATALSSRPFDGGRLLASVLEELERAKSARPGKERTDNDCPPQL